METRLIIPKRVETASVILSLIFVVSGACLTSFAFIGAAASVIDISLLAYPPRQVMMAGGGVAGLGLLLLGTLKTELISTPTTAPY